MTQKPHQRTKEWGDFQTPRSFSEQVCALLFEKGIRPRSILEPTCGMGNFLLSALEYFPSAATAVGIDINADYIEHLKGTLATQGRGQQRHVTVAQGDFFDFDWPGLLDSLAEPILVIGNPPWVTNAELTKLRSDNLPEKSNLWDFSGLDAITGKSNFDISEWMLIQLLAHIQNRDAVLAMLCKTSVARKVLQYAWEKDFRLESSSIYLFDAHEIFGVSTDAGLLICKTSRKQSCKVYGDLSEEVHAATFGLRDDQLISRPRLYDRWKHLQGSEHYRWRSGIKHDAARVMELEKEAEGYRNKLGELYVLESDYLYPMLKSSDVANGKVADITRWMLVTQKFVGEATTAIRDNAPRTWQYLQEHQAFFDSRKSAVYKDRPPFSIFGVGDYAFAMWKVAISGLYKTLHFAVIGPYAGKPVVLDDTCYFISCDSQEEAEYLATLLNSEIAQEFFSAYIFWDKKRPITAGILRRLDLMALAKELGSENPLESLGRAPGSSDNWRQQIPLGLQSA